MKQSISFAAGALAFLFSSGSILTSPVLAKEKLVVVEDTQQKMVSTPTCGQGTTCGICAINDEFNQICLNYGATAKVGWRFD